MTTDNILRHGADMEEKLILREVELVKLLNISASTIRRKIKAGTFPRYVKLGPKAKGWRTSDIETWLNNLKS
jgi:prophage regulatory protein